MLLSEAHGSLRNRGVKVFQVLAQTSETCNDYRHMALLKTLHNNLGGHGPDGGSEGLRYKARLSGGYVSEDEDVIVDVHADSSYRPAYPEHNGLSSGAANVLAVAGHSLSELCDDGRCNDAMSFGSINIPPDSSVNITFSFYDPDLKPKFLDEISLTWFDLDHAGCADPPDCEPLTVESVTPRGDYSAYLSSTTTVRYDLVHSQAAFAARRRGDVHDNPINSRLLTQDQIDKAVTSIYSRVHQVTVTLGATSGRTPRFFLFDFVPTLLCAEMVKDWPAWVKIGGKAAPTAAPILKSTSTDTTTTTTTTTTVGGCAVCSPGLRRWTGELGCTLERAQCWVASRVPDVLHWFKWVVSQIRESMGDAMSWAGKAACDAAADAESDEVDGVDGKVGVGRKMERLCSGRLMEPSRNSTGAVESEEADLSKDVLYA